MNDINNLSSQVEFITDNNIKINGLSNINESLSCHYLIYRIENVVNGKHYVGQHKTENPLDSYVGSGKIIRQAVKKEGIEKFVKTILFDFDNFEEMNEKEKELVSLSACYPYDPMSYNILEGGANQRSFKGPANGMYGKKLKDYMSEEKYEAWLKSNAEASRKVAQRPQWHKKMSEVTSGKNNPMYGKNWQDFSTPEKIEQWRHNISLGTSGKNNPMYGKDSWSKHTLEQRKARIDRFSKSMKGKNKDKKPLIDPETGKKVFVKGKEYDECIANGYVPYSNKGRKLMFRPGQDRISITVSKEEVKTYLEEGYVIGNIGQILLNRKGGNKDPYNILMISTEKKIVRVSNGSIQNKQKQGYVRLSDYYPEIVSKNCER